MKEAKEYWEGLSIKQQDHFLKDHKSEFNRSSWLGWLGKDFDKLPANVQKVISKHVEEGIYKSGGSFSDFLAKAKTKAKSAYSSTKKGAKEFAKSDFVKSVKKTAKDVFVATKKGAENLFDKAKDKYNESNKTTSKTATKPERAKRKTQADYKESLLFEIEKDGFDYTFLAYSNWEKIKDDKFHALRKKYVSASKNISKYIESNDPIDTKYDISTKDALDKEGIDSAFTSYHNWKDVKDVRFQAQLKTFLSAKKNLESYIEKNFGTLEQYKTGGGFEEFEKPIEPEDRNVYIIGKRVSTKDGKGKIVSDDGITLEIALDSGGVKEYRTDEEKVMLLDKQVNKYAKGTNIEKINAYETKTGRTKKDSFGKILFNMPDGKQAYYYSYDDAKIGWLKTKNYSKEDFKKGDKVVLKHDLDYHSGNEEILVVVGFDKDYRDESKLILEGVKKSKTQRRSYVYPKDVVFYSDITRKYAKGSNIEYDNKYDLRGWRKSQKTWVVINKNPMSYDEAKEMLESARKSGLYDTLTIESNMLKKPNYANFSSNEKGGQYAKGSNIKKVDLFEYPEMIPNNVQKVLDHYSESFEDGDYAGLQEAEEELSYIGYTFEYGLDGQAYALRPIGVKVSELEGYEDYKESNHESEEDTDTLSRKQILEETLSAIGYMLENVNSWAIRNTAAKLSHLDFYSEAIAVADEDTAYDILSEARDYVRRERANEYIVDEIYDLVGQYSQVRYGKGANINLSSKLQEYVEKYHNKMSGATEQGAAYWVDGIRDLTDSEKGQLFTEIRKHARKERAERTMPAWVDKYCCGGQMYAKGTTIGSGQGSGFNYQYQNDELYNLFYDKANANYDKFYKLAIKKGFSESTIDEWYEHRNDDEDMYRTGGNMTKYVFVSFVQGNYGYGWEDLTAHNTRLEAKKEMKVYDENERYPHRVITRRVLRTDYEKGNYRTGGFIPWSEVEKYQNEVRDVLLKEYDEEDAINNFIENSSWLDIGLDEKWSSEKTASKFILSQWEEEQYAKGSNIDKKNTSKGDKYFIREEYNSAGKMYNKVSLSYETGIKDIEYYKYNKSYEYQNGAFYRKSDGTLAMIFRESKLYSTGGQFEHENREMVLNNNKQIAHHTKELAEAVKDKHVPAWVVAKVNRSASDLSDATHYMEGHSEQYAKGSNILNKKESHKLIKAIDTPTMGEYKYNDLERREPVKEISNSGDYTMFIPKHMTIGLNDFQSVTKISSIEEGRKIYLNLLKKLHVSGSDTPTAYIYDKNKNPIVRVQWQGDVVTPYQTLEGVWYGGPYKLVDDKYVYTNRDKYAKGSNVKTDNLQELKPLNKALQDLGMKFQSERSEFIDRYENELNDIVYFDYPKTMENWKESLSDRMSSALSQYRIYPERYATGTNVSSDWTKELTNDENELACSIMNRIVKPGPYVDCNNLKYANKKELKQAIESNMNMLSAEGKKIATSLLSKLN